MIQYTLMLTSEFLQLINLLNTKPGHIFESNILTRVRLGWDLDFFQQLVKRITNSYILSSCDDLVILYICFQKCKIKGKHK